MRHVIRTGVVVSGIVLCGTAMLSAQWGRPSTPRSGACFYENANFEGRSFCAAIGDEPERVPDGADDKISSIRLFGDARVTVFKDSRQRGDSRSYRSSVSNLSDEGFNDTITSYRVESDHYSGGRFGGGGWENDWGRPPVPRTGICFYEDRNFRGSYFCSSVGASSARVTEEANNRISSVQVFGSAEVRVYEDRDYRGDSTTFRSSIPDLQSSGWNNRISSFQVRAAGYGGGFGSGGWQGETSNSNSNIRMSRTQAEAVVRRAYRNILDREPDPGAEGWVKEVMDGKLNERQLEARLRQSPEYRNR